MSYVGPLSQSCHAFSDCVVGDSPRSPHACSARAEKNLTHDGKELMSTLRIGKTTTTVAPPTALCTPHSNGSPHGHPSHRHTRHRDHGCWRLLRQDSDVISAKGDADCAEEDAEPEGLMGSVRLSRHIPQREGVDMSICSFNLTDALELSQPMSSSQLSSQASSLYHGSMSMNSIHHTETSGAPPPPHHPHHPHSGPVHPASHTPPPSLPATPFPSDSPAAPPSSSSLAAFLSLPDWCPPSGNPSSLPTAFPAVGGVVGLAGLSYPAATAVAAAATSSSVLVSHLSDTCVSDDSSHLTSRYNDRLADELTRGHHTGSGALLGTPFGTPLSHHHHHHGGGGGGGSSSSSNTHQRRLTRPRSRSRSRLTHTNSAAVASSRSRTHRGDLSVSSPLLLLDDYAGGVTGVVEKAAAAARPLGGGGGCGWSNWAATPRVGGAEVLHFDCSWEMMSQTSLPASSSYSMSQDEDTEERASGRRRRVSSRSASPIRVAGGGGVRGEVESSCTTAAAAAARAPVSGAGSWFSWPPPPRRRASPAATARVLPTNPECVLDAPDFPADAPQLIHWGSNNKLLVGMANTVYVWDAETRHSQKLTELPAPVQIRCVHWIHKCLCVALSAQDGATVIFDCRNETTLRKVRLPEGEVVRAMAVHGPLLAIGSSRYGMDNESRAMGADAAWRVSAARRDSYPAMMSRAQHQHHILPDGNDNDSAHTRHRSPGYYPDAYPYNAGAEAACTRVYDLRIKNALIARLAVAGGSEVQTLRYCHAEPFYLASGEVGGSVRVWDARRPDAPRYAYRAVHRGAVSALLWNPDHRSRLFTGGADGVLTMIDTHAPTRLLGRVPTLDDNDDNDEDRTMPGQPGGREQDTGLVSAHHHHHHHPSMTHAGGVVQTYPYPSSEWAASRRLVDDAGRHCIHRAVNTMSPVTGIVCHGGGGDEMVSTHRAQGQLQLRKMSNFHLLGVCRTRSAEADILCVTAAPDRERVCAAQTDETLTFWRVFERPGDGRAGGGSHGGGEEDCNRSARRRTPVSVMEEHIR